MKYKFLLFISLMLFLIGIVSSATYFVNDPTNCPVSYQSQTCSGSDLVCGYQSGVTFCYDMSIVNAPGSSATSSTSYSGSYDGGYLLDCYSYTGSEPYCTNNDAMWCDRDSSCYNVNRITQCEANKWSGDASDTTCTTCRSGYTYCDGSYTDADGCEIQSGVTQFNHTSGVLEDNTNHLANCSAACDSGYLDCDSDIGTGGTGCEVQDGGSCSVGSLSGTYSGCTCVVDKSYFQTGTFIEYLVNLADGSMLWFKNWGTGDLINASNVNNDTFRVDNETNVITSGNYTGSWFKGIFNWIIGATSTKYLSFNGTQLDFNETQLNATIDIRSGSCNLTNVAFVNKTNIFLENQTIDGYLNITGGILLEDNATISRSGVDTKTWLSESGNWITQFGA